MSNEEMEEERFVLFNMQIFFSTINKNESNCNVTALSVTTFGVRMKPFKFTLSDIENWEEFQRVNRTTWSGLYPTSVNEFPKDWLN